MQNSSINDVLVNHEKNDITFNDSIFLNACKRLSTDEENQNPENGKCEVQKERSRVVTDTQTSQNEVSQNTIVSTQERCALAVWDLPEAILEKYRSRGLVNMFPWQAECLSNPKVLADNKNLVYSAPTSAGKTLVAEILSIKTVLERHKKVIIILPFVSVVREKMFYFQDILSSSGVRVEGFMGSHNPPGGFKMVNLAICTIEKANGIVNRLLEDGSLEDIGAVIIDEMHLLGDSSRGYLLELLLTKLRYMCLKNKDIDIQIIGMSATLPNLDLLAKWLDAELYTTNFRPIPLCEYCLVHNEIYNSDLKLDRKLKPIPDLTEDTDNILQICLETISSSCSVLIFCPTKNWCENLAQQISVAFWKLGRTQSHYGQCLRDQLSFELITEALEQLQRCPVGLDSILKKTVSFGVAFHHAGLTMDERDIVEGAFRNGALRVLVATSTLSSGVNLPARRVIIRTPMFHGKPIDTLVYRQMIGRAGRMGKDSAGESILICQKNDRQIAAELMSAKLQPIESCLEGAGKLKRAILEIIASGVASTVDDVNLFANCTLLASSVSEFNKENDPIGKAIEFLTDNEFIRLQNNEQGELHYVPTSLAKACLSSSLPPEDGLALFEELEKARRCFVLDTELHLLYLVTPYSVCYQWHSLDWMLFLSMWEKLPPSDKRVAELVGVKESFIFNSTRGKLNSNSSKMYHRLQIHKRFYTALALHDLVNEVPLNEVADKFQCSRGMLQSLQQSASTFAGMVTAFSRQLGWTCIEILISQFQDRLQFGIHHELLDLMKLPLLNGPRARTLYNADIKTLIDLASFDVCKLENILYSAVPFQSEKEREGETSHDVQQKKNLRSFWITGKKGLTAREAAVILIEDARKYLQYEMGVEVKWDTAGSNESDSSSTESNSSDASLDANKSNAKNKSATSKRKIKKSKQSIRDKMKTKYAAEVNKTSINNEGQIQVMNEEVNKKSVNNKEQIQLINEIVNKTRINHEEPIQVNNETKKENVLSSNNQEKSINKENTQINLNTTENEDVVNHSLNVSTEEKNREVNISSLGNTPKNCSLFNDSFENIDFTSANPQLSKRINTSDSLDMNMIKDIVNFNENITDNHGKCIDEIKEDVVVSNSNNVNDIDIKNKDSNIVSENKIEQKNNQSIFNDSFNINMEYTSSNLNNNGQLNEQTNQPLTVTIESDKNKSMIQNPIATLNNVVNKNTILTENNVSNIDTGHVILQHNENLSIFNDSFENIMECVSPNLNNTNTINNSKNTELTEEPNLNPARPYIQQNDSVFNDSFENIIDDISPNKSSSTSKTTENMKVDVPEISSEKLNEYQKDFKDNSEILIESDSSNEKNHSPKISPKELKKVCANINKNNTQKYEFQSIFNDSFENNINCMTLNANLTKKSVGKYLSNNNKENLIPNNNIEPNVDTNVVVKVAKIERNVNQSIFDDSFENNMDDLHMNTNFTKNSENITKHNINQTSAHEYIVHNNINTPIKLMKRSNTIHHKEILNTGHENNTLFNDSFENNVNFLNLNPNISNKCTNETKIKTNNWSTPGKSNIDNTSSLTNMINQPNKDILNGIQSKEGMQNNNKSAYANEFDYNWTTFENANDSNTNEENNIIDAASFDLETNSLNQLNSNLFNVTSKSDSLFGDSICLDSKICDALDISTQSNKELKIEDSTLSENNINFFPNLEANVTKENQIKELKSRKENMTDSKESKPIILNDGNEMVVSSSIDNKNQNESIDHADNDFENVDIEMDDSSLFEKVFTSSFNIKYDGKNNSSENNQSAKKENVSDVVDTSQTDMVIVTGSISALYSSVKKSKRKEPSKKKRKNDDNSLKHFETPNKKKKVIISPKRKIDSVNDGNSLKLLETPVKKKEIIITPKNDINIVDVCKQQSTTSSMMDLKVRTCDTPIENKDINNIPKREVKINICKNEDLNNEEKTIPLPVKDTNKRKKSSNTDKELNIVDVCNSRQLFDSFSVLITKQLEMSFSIGCERFVQVKPMIGQKVVKTPKAKKVASTSKLEYISGSRKVCGVSLFWGEQIYFISFKNIECISNSEKISLLQRIVNNDKVNIIVYDSKEQCKILYKACGISINCRLKDPKVADWLIEPGETEKNLVDMVAKYAEDVEWATNIIQEYPQASSVALQIDNVAGSQIRSSVEAFTTWHIIESQNKIFLDIDERLLKTFNIEMDSIRCLIQMELNGLGVDGTKMNNLVSIIQTQMVIIEKQAFKLAGRNFCFSSSKDVAKVLGIYKGKKISTNKQALEQIENPLSNLVLQWRKLSCILTKMLFPVLRCIKQNRIYGSCITRTTTGRISMHEPNLQCIPRNFDLTHTDKTIVPISVRATFTPSEGKVLLSADYCQLELRILAHLSQDPILCEIMRSEEDIFKSIASKLYKVPQEEIKDKLRHQAKQLCYGIIYGMGAKALSEQLQSSEEEAKEFMESFINTYPSIKQFIQKTVNTCRKKGYIETLGGRRRYLEHINDTNSAIKSQAERQAVNTTVQGSAADLAKTAMGLVEAKLRKYFKNNISRVSLVLHIHDELLFEVSTKDLNLAAKVIKRAMESAVQLSVPFPVKLKTGTSWGELNELFI